jgi:hypothetical protein
MARALGVPRDPVEATAFEASRMRSRSTRRVNVGQFHERYFLFSVGMGLDARVVQLVEENPEGKRKHGEWLFAGNALGCIDRISRRGPVDNSAGFRKRTRGSRARRLLQCAPVHLLQEVPGRRLSASPVGLGAGSARNHEY